MHLTTIKEKVINLKESRGGYIGRYGHVNYVVTL